MLGEMGWDKGTWYLSVLVWAFLLLGSGTRRAT
jgi:hypothetical protein